MPGTGKAFMSCSAKKVRCSFLGAKPSAEVIVSSDEGATPRQKKAKTLGLVPKAGLVTVEVKKPEWTVELLDAIREQNSLLRDLLIFQEQTSLATALQAEWAQPMTNYLGRITHVLEARNKAEGSGSGGSGSGSGSGSGGNKGKGKEKEQDENAKNGSGNRDEDWDEDGDKDGEGDSDRDADGDETMGKSL
jgi:hypothetical protein